MDAKITNSNENKANPVNYSTQGFTGDPILAVSYILFIKYNITFKQIGEGERNLLVTWERLSTIDRHPKFLKETNLAS